MRAYKHTHVYGMLHYLYIYIYPYVYVYTLSSYICTFMYVCTYLSGTCSRGRALPSFKLPKLWVRVALEVGWMSTLVALSFFWYMDADGRFNPFGAREVAAAD